IHKRENYIKRCVGLPGDEIELVDGVLYVNDQVAYQDEGVQHKYYVFTKDFALEQSNLINNEINYEFPIKQYKDSKTGKIKTEVYCRSADRTKYILTTTEKAKNKLNSEYPNVDGIQQIIDNKDCSAYFVTSLFPNSTLYNWTVDNF